MPCPESRCYYCVNVLEFPRRPTIHLRKRMLELEFKVRGLIDSEGFVMSYSPEHKATFQCDQNTLQERIASSICQQGLFELHILIHYACESCTEN